MLHTPATLRAFEQDVALTFNEGLIRSPIHLAGGNEDQLIAYFQDHFRPGDWVATAWRSHLHCLLAGAPSDEVKSAILAGRSITLTFPKYRIISSAIVGGILPIALGIALGLKRADRGMSRLYIPAPRVHVFLGDMTARTGAYHEAHQYAQGHALPISFIIEDNGKSVGTPTLDVWGTHTDPPYEERHLHDNPWPHAGSGEWIKF